MDERQTAPLKVVGRKGSPQIDAVGIDPMQRMANELREGRLGVPKGVFRFKSFDEADQWWLEMQTRPDNPASQR
jgi:hypothetical protein